MMEKETQSLQHPCHISKSQKANGISGYDIMSWENMKNDNKSPLFSSITSSRLMNTGNKTTVEAKCDICDKSSKSKSLDLV